MLCAISGSGGSDCEIHVQYYAVSEFLTTDPGVPGSIPGHYKKKVVGLERGPHSLVSTSEELLDRKVAAPV
jgi:hypothetical protein